MHLMVLCRRLEYGGAERQIVALAGGMLRRGHRVSVLTFYPGGPFVEPLIATGAEVVPVGKRGRWDLIRFLARLSRELRRRRPDILYSFLPNANVIAPVARLVVPRLPIVWGVRASNLDTARYDRLSRLFYALEPRMARFADLIIANSSAGAAHAIAHGYPKARLRVVANGIDTDRFCRDAAAGAALRAEWRIGPSLRLIGMVGRLDPMKGVPNFLRAAAELAKTDETVRFAVIGEGAEPYRAELLRFATAFGLAERITWSPARADAAAIYSALDLLVSSSAFGEGFPNVVAEAMACRIPVIATAVGDAAIVVGPWGTIVPPEDSSALAAAMRRQLDRSASETDRVTAAAQQHIGQSFSVAAMVQHTEELLLSLLRRPNVAPR